MATVSGIWNHSNPANSLAANPLGTARPAADTSGSTGTTNTDGSTISANDFLALLVTEMQNQDPTANTDPNQYVNQLVQVNSLEQLININQTLESGKIRTTPATSQQTASPALSNAVDRPGISSPPALNSQAIKITGGNLSVPNANPAAERVGHALGHHPRIN